jgi:hypothetical protein
VKVQDLIANLQTAKTARILILDACRGNDAIKQFASQKRGLRRGLAAEKADGILIAFATQANQSVEAGTRRSVSIAPSQAGRGTECDRHEALRLRRLRRTTSGIVTRRAETLIALSGSGRHAPRARPEGDAPKTSPAMAVQRSSPDP